MTKCIICGWEHGCDCVVETVSISSAPASCSEVWSAEEPTEDGIYLCKMDDWDDDNEADTFHLRAGKFYKDGGSKEWICYGGMWKRIGDLPNSKLSEPPA